MDKMVDLMQTLPSTPSRNPYKEIFTKDIKPQRQRNKSDRSNLFLEDG